VSIVRVLGLNAYNSGGYQGVINISNAASSDPATKAARNEALVNLNAARNAKLAGSASPITWVGDDGKTYTAESYMLSNIGGSYAPGGASYSPTSTFTSNLPAGFDSSAGLQSSGASSLSSSQSSPYTYSDAITYYSNNANQSQIDSLRSAINNYRSFTSTPQPTWDDVYKDAYNAALNEVLGRQEFSYDLNTDPNYQAYAQQYLMEGDRATQNTIAQMAALSGGMPSSAAATAGQQAGDYYAAQLSAKVPELYQQAYQRYVDEFNMDRSALGDVYNARNFDYGIYRDDVGDYQANRDFDYSDYLNQYDMLQNSLNNYVNADETAYGRSRDAIADARYTDETAYNRERDAIADALYADETAYSRSRDALGDTRYETEYADALKQQDYENMTQAQKDAFNSAWAMFEAGVINDNVAKALGYATTAQLQAAYDAAVKAAKSSGTGTGSEKESADVYVEGRGPVTAEQLALGLKNGTVKQGTRNGTTYYYASDGITPISLPGSSSFYGVPVNEQYKIIESTYGKVVLDAMQAVGRVISGTNVSDKVKQQRAEEALANYDLSAEEYAGILQAYGLSYK
jgi:hypothetical protein